MSSTSYRDVIRLPGALRAFLPAMLGRLSFATITLAVVLAVEAKTESFAVAGIAVGAFGVTNVVASPFRARLVDRYGQRLILNSLCIGYALGLVALAVLTLPSAVVSALPSGVTEATEPSSATAYVAIVAVSALTGLFPPPLGSAMRVLWGALAPVGTLRARAYSLDAVGEELLFTAGPLLVAATVAIGSPTIAIMFTAVAAVAGTFGMTSSTVSGAVPRGTVNVPIRSRPLRQKGFLPVLVALLAVGTVLGVVEVAAPAFADDLGSAGLAGILLAAFAAGSAIGGLLYGSRVWPGWLGHRLLLLATAMTLLCAALVFAPGSTVLACGLAAVGFFLAPSLVTGYLLADELTEPAVRTEASSWINTAVNTGAALAAAAGGVLVDATSPGLAFVLGAAVASLCLLCAAPFLRRPISVQLRFSRGTGQRASP
ncbi:MAG: Major Facilitator Superfamily protein [Glaciihabitans sp.]|nr:Major Facilitator Superfamily protein [Glaciihabitans sp.]